MPMKRELYPSNWREISQRIRERAGNRCETCGVLNGAIGYREKDGAFVQLGKGVQDAGMAVEVAALVDGYKVIKIVLTCAHINDSDPSNCDESNLKSLCQRCHNRLDVPMRQRNAAATRLKKKLARQPQLMEVI